jgi:hypothetical protein
MVNQFARFRTLAMQASNLVHRRDEPVGVLISSFVSSSHSTLFTIRASRMGSETSATARPSERAISRHYTAFLSLVNSSYYSCSPPRRKSFPDKGLGGLKSVYVLRGRFCPPAAGLLRKPFGSKGLGISARSRAAEQKNGPRRKFFNCFMSPDRFASAMSRAS